MKKSLQSATECQSLQDYIEKAYLNYSMYVILDRALPHVGDGMKPVQRRIIYAMSELGLKASAKFKKSARTVGDVLGKYHPHGDSACYEAMVLMAQPFSYRYPLIEGQGNWGSTDDPKSFAAMRYTESRLTPMADLLLAEIGQGTTDWLPNFDSTLEEPSLLPAKIPHLLLNGTTGIAVGMATDIPPHNLTEVGEACLHLLDHPHADTLTLCQFIKGPDFACEAEIISTQEDIIKIYTTGRGSLRMRALYEQDKKNIIITALPHQVSGAKILEQIAQQMQKKKLPMLVDLRDESDHEQPTRLVMILRDKTTDAHALMHHLFATTDLERSYRVNMNMIGLDGRPAVKSLQQILSEWLSFRITTVQRRLSHRLKKVTTRLHLLDGLMIAFLNIDEVIRIIRQEDDPKPVLIKQFALSDTQADAILDLKLRHLARLEEHNIHSEQSQLSQERQSLENTLSSEKQLKNLIKKEIKQIIKQHGDPRRSPIVSRQQAQVMAESERVRPEPVTLVLSKKGWIRCAKGFDLDPSTLNYKVGDSFWRSTQGYNHQPTIILDTQGRSYGLTTHTLASARGQGEPISGRIQLENAAQPWGLLLGNPEQSVVLASDTGYGFITTLGDMNTKNKAGKALMSLPENASLLSPILLHSDPALFQLTLVTNEGRLLIFPLQQLPCLSRGKGNRMIQLPAARGQERSEWVLDWAVMQANDTLQVHSGQRHMNLKLNDMAYYQGERGRRGKKLPRGFQRVSRLLVVSAPTSTAQ